MSLLFTICFSAWHTRCPQGASRGASTNRDPVAARPIHCAHARLPPILNRNLSQRKERETS
jgi:hypothetical protein